MNVRKNDKLSEGLYRSNRPKKQTKNNPPPIAHRPLSKVAGISCHLSLRGRSKKLAHFFNCCHLIFYSPTAVHFRRIEAALWARPIKVRRNKPKN